MNQDFNRLDPYPMSASKSPVEKLGIVEMTEKALGGLRSAVAALREVTDRLDGGSPTLAGAALVANERGGAFGEIERSAMAVNELSSEVQSLVKRIYAGL
jgi:hypothetical protein